MIYLLSAMLPWKYKVFGSITQILLLFEGIVINAVYNSFHLKFYYEIRNYTIEHFSMKIDMAFFQKSL